MRKKVTYCLWAWVVLIAFCQMMAVKQLHHHDHCTHGHGAHDCICVLDHLPLDECRHSHASLIAYDSEEDDCAICHFTIAKLFQPKYVITPVVTTQYSVLQEADYHFLPGVFYARCSGRAPPCF